MSKSEIKPVTIPREVADAIDTFRSSGVENSHIAVLAIGGGMGPSAHVLNEWARAGNFDILMRALLDGYERELEPEEAVVVLYEGLRESERIANGMYGGDPYQYAFAARTVKRVLNALRIVIPGINDVEEGGAA